MVPAIITINVEARKLINNNDDHELYITNFKPVTIN